jgi:hypothetical protein
MAPPQPAAFIAFAAACAVKKVPLRILSRNRSYSLGHLDERLRREDAGIVEQHVETAEPIDRGRYEGLSGRRKDDVAGIGDGPLPRGIHLTGGRFCLCGITPIDDDRAALSDEPGRDLLAHTRATARDDGNLLLETHNVSPWRISTYR